MWILPLLALLACVSGQLITFTGDARNDFRAAFLLPEGFRRNYVIIPNNIRVVPLENPEAENFQSGSDVSAVHLLYDWQEDELYVGIDCNGICGDTDGDGDPSSSSDPNIVDNPDMCGESFAMMLWPTPPSDWVPSRNRHYPTLIVGVPLSECLDQFRVAAFAGAASCPNPLATPQPTCATTQQTRSILVPDSVWDSTLRTISLFASPSAEAPDLEFRIPNFSELAGTPWTAGLESWNMGISWVSRGAGGISEDYQNPINSQFLCPAEENGECVLCVADICGECGGNNETCVCSTVLGSDFAQVDKALLQYTIGEAKNKIGTVIETLQSIRSQWKSVPSNSSLPTGELMTRVRGFCGECLDAFHFASASFADFVAGHCDTSCPPLSLEDFSQWD